MIGTQYTEDENQNNRRMYPWDGHQVRNPYGKQMGKFLANFKRGRGDYAGIAGSLNDGAMITDYIYAYPPNDFGLYNMAGNVNEWVQDVYRPLSFQDVEDLNPFRRDGFLDEATNYDSSEGYHSLVSDEVRVYKGGSWKDVAYWLSPGTRRFMAQDSSTATIGFRCAMINAGSNK
jgi:formylglycine-generating enzyme